MIILGHHCLVSLLAKMLIWAHFLQSMCAFSFCINPEHEKIAKNDTSFWPPIKTTFSIKKSLNTAKKVNKSFFIS